MAAFLIVGAVLGCGDQAAPSRSASDVTISPTAATLTVGDTLRFEAMALDQTGAALPATSITWSSSHPEVAEIDGTGLVTGVGPGTGGVMATAGETGDTAQVEVTDPDPGPQPPEPPGPEPPPPGEDPPPPPNEVVVAAGDIAACAPTYQDEATAELLDDIPGTILALGDNVYPGENPSSYPQCYHPSWGRHRDRTRPAPGNHEVKIEEMRAYFDYFGSRAGPEGRGYYSYDLGGWHLVSLNSEQDLDEQVEWLKADLAASGARCVLAYWHRSLFTSEIVNGPITRMRPLFEVLYQAGAELVLSAHSHVYERFAPQAPDGTRDDARGVRQFTVGTGGSPYLYQFGPPARNSEVRDNGGHGVLKLTLRPTGYDYEFVPVPGNDFRDSGSGSCH